MHRQHSLQPFSRHYSHSTNPFLDFLELEDDVSVPASTSPTSFTHKSSSALSKLPSDISSNAQTNSHITEAAITVRSSDPVHLRAVLAAYKAVQRAGTLHTVTFVTVNEYLWLLRALARELSVLGRRAMYYLAAAVSDFFLPREKMVSFTLNCRFSRGSTFELAEEMNVWRLRLLHVQRSVG